MLSVFDEMVLTDIASLNVTETVVETEMSVELSAGLTEESVGAIVSVVVVSVVVVCSSFSLQEKMMKLKRNTEKMMSICLI